MAVPDYQTLMLPLLKFFGDGKEYSIRDAVDKLAVELKLSDADLNEKIPSGTQTLLYNRIGWARIYMTKAGLLEKTRHSVYRITERGQAILAEQPKTINAKFLNRFPEFVEFRQRKSTGAKHSAKNGRQAHDTRTPEEILIDGYIEIRKSLAQELLENVMQCSPSFFERLVVELLVKIGYGGSWEDAARAVGQTNDGGIDGIIDEDRLGLDAIYIQAKRWQNTVSRPEIQKFVGALAGKGAQKGIFITTSSFSEGARKYAQDVNYKVVLIDGNRLAELMMDYDVGVTTVNSYHIKRVDSDFFVDG